MKEHDIPLQPLTSSDQCPPSIVGCIANNIQGDYAMLSYNRYGIHISTGSACSLGYAEIPRSIFPFISNKEEGKRYIRFSFSHLTTEQDILTIIEVSIKIFNPIKEERIHNEKKINWQGTS